MRTLNQRLEIAKVVLTELNKQNQTRSILERKTVSTSSTTHACFEGIFNFLVQNEYIQKIANAHRAPYGITDKGQKFLEAL